MSMNEKLRGEREFDCETSIGSHTLATFPERGKQGVISKAKPKNTNDKRQSVTQQAKPARKGKAREQSFFDREKQDTPLD